MRLKQVIINAAGIGQQWAGIPGIEWTPSGRLFVSCFSGGKNEPDSENTVYVTARLASRMREEVSA